MIADAALALVQVALVAGAAPLVTGCVRSLGARAAGRAGPSPWQPYRDLQKLAAKETLVSETASWISRVAPWISAGAMLAAAAAVPVVVARPPLGFAGILLIAYLFALATFFVALAGLDAGSVWGGLGASRAVAAEALALPTLVLAVFALSLQAGTASFAGIVERLAQTPALAASLPHLLALGAVAVAVVAEVGRLGAGAPAAWPELSAGHQTILLEYSGRDLALIEWASAMRLLVLLTLLVNVFVPWGPATRLAPGALLLGALAVAVKLAAATALVALAETFAVRLARVRVPAMLAAGLALSVLSLAAALLLPPA